MGIVALAQHHVLPHSRHLFHSSIPGDHPPIPVNNEGGIGKKFDDVEQPLVSRQQSLLAPFPVGDIPYRRHPHHLTKIGDDFGMDFQGNPDAILAAGNDLIFFLIIPDHVGLDDGPVLRVNQLQHIPSNELVPAVAGHLGESLIHIDDLAIILEDNPLMRSFLREFAKPCFTFPQGGFSPPTLFDLQFEFCGPFLHQFFQLGLILLELFLRPFLPPASLDPGLQVAHGKGFGEIIESTGGCDIFV